MKDTIAEVLSQIGWLLEEAEKQETPPLGVKKIRTTYKAEGVPSLQQADN
jgi:hypothetical protein